MRPVHPPLLPYFLALVCSLGNMNVFTLDLNMPASQERLHGLWPGDRPSMWGEA